MDPFSLPPLAFLLDAAASALWQLSVALTPLAHDFSASVAVVVVTVVVRALLVPAGVAQAKAERTRARLAPRLRELQRRHGSDPERLQRETMRLYRDEKASPFAGCLPMIAQAPIVGLLYAVFLRSEISGHANVLLDETLFGVPLGTSLAGSVAAGSLTPETVMVLGTLIALIAAVGELTRRAFRMPGTPAVLAGVVGTAQFATAVVAGFVPLAAALYLAVTVVWTLVQRLVLRRIWSLPE